MKKTVLFLCFLYPLITYSQDGEAFKKNDIKLNAAYLIAGDTEISYERILDEEVGIGVSAGFRFDKDVEYKYSFIPHARFYFSRKPGAGFFMEGNVALYWEKGYRVTYLGPYSVHVYDDASIFGFGGGLGVGGKFISRRGIIGELLGGIGRTFTNTDQLDVIYPRFGVLIGKRF